MTFFKKGKSMFSDFLSIFKSAFHKFTLDGVRELGEFKLGKYEYYKFIGKFSFELPDAIDPSQVDNKKFLVLLRSLPMDEGHCFARKYSRKIYLGGKMIRKCSFRYDFDINPKTICGFDFDGRKMVLYAVGYGTF